MLYLVTLPILIFDNIFVSLRSVSTVFGDPNKGGVMWLGQAKFFCTRCGVEVTDNIHQLIVERCKTLSIDPLELGDKAREAIKTEMLRELGEKPVNPTELAFIEATALLLLEFAYSPVLLCDQCRSPILGDGIGDRVGLRLIKGGRAEK
jgi:hypothetical protein